MLSFSLELFDIRDNICRLKLLLWSDKFLLLFFFFLTHVLACAYL